MLQSNYIGFLLNLKEVCVISYSKSSIVISLPQKYHICPNCKHKTNKAHDYRLQKIKHLFKTEEPISIFFVNIDMFALIVQSVKKIHF